MQTQDKTCTKCGITKPLDSFHRHPNQRSGRHPQCKECRSVYTRARYLRDGDKIRAYDRVYKKQNRAKLAAKSRAYYARNRETIGAASRGYRLKCQYGITVDEWDQMFAAQGSACAACGDSAPDGHGRWHTDHCHDTGIVRGILCHNCNVSLGLLRDSPERLLALHAYLVARS